MASRNVSVSIKHLSIYCIFSDTTGYITCNLNYYKEKGHIEFHLYDEARRVFAPHEEVESQAFFITAHCMAAIPDDRIVAFINDIAYECEQSVTVQFLLESPRGSLDRLLEENGDEKKVFWSSFSNVLTVNLETWFYWLLLIISLLDPFNIGIPALKG